MGKHVRIIGILLLALFFCPAMAQKKIAFAFSPFFFLPKFHREKITLIKPTWSSGKASVILLICLHMGARSSTCFSYKGQGLGFLTPVPMGEST